MCAFAKAWPALEAGTFGAGESISDERDLEPALIKYVEQFMLAAGSGRLSFVGRQFPLVVGADEFFIDLHYSLDGISNPITVNRYALKAEELARLRSRRPRPAKAEDAGGSVSCPSRSSCRAPSRRTRSSSSCFTPSRPLLQRDLSGVIPVTASATFCLNTLPPVDYPINVFC